MTEKQLNANSINKFIFFYTDGVFFIKKDGQMSALQDLTFKTSYNLHNIDFLNPHIMVTNT